MDVCRTGYQNSTIWNHRYEHKTAYIQKVVKIEGIWGAPKNTKNRPKWGSGGGWFWEGPGPGLAEKCVCLPHFGGILAYAGLGPGQEVGRVVLGVFLGYGQRRVKYTDLSICKNIGCMQRCNNTDMYAYVTYMGMQ